MPAGVDRSTPPASGPPAAAAGSYRRAYSAIVTFELASRLPVARLYSTIDLR